MKNPSNSQNVLDPVKTWRGHEDCVNGVQFHPKVSLFASASGQRHFSMLLSDDDDIDEDVDDGKQEKKHEDLAENKSTLENSIKIWTFDNP